MTKKEVLESELTRVIGNTDFLKEVVDNDILKRALVTLSNDLYEIKGLLSEVD